MSQLRTYLLGPFRVTRDDKSVIGFESDKMRALLAYLVVEADRPHRREALATLLWPDQTDNAARQSLRQALYILRHTLGGDSNEHSADSPSIEAKDGGNTTHSVEPLQITRQTVQLNPESDTVC